MVSQYEFTHIDLPWNEFYGIYPRGISQGVLVNLTVTYVRIYILKSLSQLPGANRLSDRFARFK